MDGCSQSRCVYGKCTRCYQEGDCYDPEFEITGIKPLKVSIAVPDDMVEEAKSMSYPKGTLVYRPLTVYRKVYTKREAEEGEDTDDTDSPPKMVTVSEYASSFYLKAKVQYLWFQSSSGKLMRASGGSSFSRDVTYSTQVGTFNVVRDYRLSCKDESCSVAKR